MDEVDDRQLRFHRTIRAYGEGLGDHPVADGKAFGPSDECIALPPQLSGTFTRLRVVSFAVWAIRTLYPGVLSQRAL